MAILNVAGQTIDTNHVSGQLADVKLPYIPDFLQSFLRNAILKKIIVAVGPELLALMVDAADGLSDDEIDKHAKNLTQIVSDSTHLPEMIVEPLVRALLSYATKGKSLTLTAGA